MRERIITNADVIGSMHRLSLNLSGIMRLFTRNSVLEMRLLTYFVRSECDYTDQQTVCVIHVCTRNTCRIVGQNLMLYQRWALTSKTLVRPTYY